MLNEGRLGGVFRGSMSFRECEMLLDRVLIVRRLDCKCVWSTVKVTRPGTMQAGEPKNDVAIHPFVICRVE